MGHTAETLQRAPDEKANFGPSVPFILVHLLAFSTPFFTGFPLEGILLALALYYVRMFAITAGFHRYFSHRAYKTSRVFQFLLALLGTTSVQKGVLWWAAHHRHHHKYSDQQEDIHSPRKGFWWSHIGWIVCSKYNDTRYEDIRDFEDYPELRWLNENYLLVNVAFATSLFLIGGMTWLLWGFFVSTTLLWHGTFTINSLTHVIGKPRYVTGDDSKNHFLLAMITLGEGWHNNHHYYQSAAKQGFFWWELDGSYYLLKMLSWLGIVWDLRVPPKHLLAKNLVRPQESDTELLAPPQQQPV